MYLITVIPTKRKIPDGELSYIASDQLTVGTIIDAPIKKSIEKSLIISVKNVQDEKSYIKSLPWKLLKIEKQKYNIILKKEIVAVINNFSIYSLVSRDVIIRACLKEIKFKKIKINENSKTLIITSGNKKLVKQNDTENIATFATFLEFFQDNKSKINHIIIDDPENLSLYSINYLGFDGVAFIVLLAKNLNIKISFQSHNTRLRYNEWNVEQIKKLEINNKSDLRIISRENEPHTEKQYPLSIPIQEVILKNISQRILIITPTKNFSPKTSCGDCGQIHSCPECYDALKLVKNNRNYAKNYGISGNYIFICLNCKKGYTALAKCTNCDSWNLTPLGYGIERIIENVENIVPKNYKNNIYDFSTSIKQKDIKNWQTNGGIIVGPLNTINEVNNCDICIVPSLGALLYNEFFESVERARDILHYVNNCTHGMIVSVMQDMEKDFLNQKEKDWQKIELADRKNLYYPPYARHVIFILDPYASKVEKIQKDIIKILENVQTGFGLNLNVEKNILGQVKIHASFPTTNWSITNDDYGLPKKIANDLLPFLKYLKIEVY